uniref:Secreted protein n=1 Tax=Haemonchus placei TaxID=6290 RepID=A0A158QNF3_HAEPC
MRTKPVVTLLVLYCLMRDQHTSSVRNQRLLISHIKVLCTTYRAVLGFIAFRAAAGHYALFAVDHSVLMRTLNAVLIRVILL